METAVTIDSLIKKVISYNSEADIELLKKAYIFSREAHCSHFRAEGTPYIGHPLAVADILADMRMDVSSIAAGLLHDTIEDTETTIDDIKEMFGEEIAFLVNALTKLSKIEFKTREEAQAENFRKMLLAMSEDLRVIIIKFADRLHNMRTLQYLPENKQQRIATETIEIYAPLANRLGIGWLRIELEDLSFKYLMPELYEDLRKKVAKRKEEQEGYLQEVSRLVEERLIEAGLYGKVSGRVKHFYGIYQKMQRQGIPFEQVHDVLGLRIITDTKANCYTIMGLIHSLWTPIPGRFKDYIAMPKSNMYQSLHTTVIGPRGERIEFQIRTEEMHKVAEEGIASHWKYKEKGFIEEKDSKYISWLRELIQSQKELKDAREFLEALKGEVVPDVVYVFTPRGEIKELPAGSTPIDFAYSIHTQIGHRCIGAKVNGRIVPLRYQLKNGDTVEIITSPTHGPSRDWLKYVLTARAKNRIKQWIKTEERKQSIELGTRLLETEMKKHNIRLTSYKNDDLKALAKSFSMQTFDDLLLSIGYGKVSPHQVINRLVPEKTVEEQKEKITRPQKEIKGISIKGIDHILYHKARCCYPVPGDNLVGFVTRGRGVTIHRRDCPNIETIAVDSERLVEIEWKPENDSTTTARLLVETVDRPGIIAALSSLISSANINISHLHASSTSDKRAYITLNLEVKDRMQLSGLMQKIVQTEGVLRVKR